MSPQLSFNTNRDSCFNARLQQRRPQTTCSDYKSLDGLNRSITPRTSDAISPMPADEKQARATAEPFTSLVRQREYSSCCSSLRGMRIQRDIPILHLETS